MHGPYPAAFAREQGFTEADWLATLRGAVRDCPLTLPRPGEAVVAIGPGHLLLHWTVLPPRQIAQVRLPRLAIRFQFDGVDEPARQAFMKYFDLFMQRGGG